MLDTVPLDQPVSADARHELVARILSSEQFSRAPRLQRFLTYIVDCYFHNRLDAVTEQQIGVHVFDKSAGYNPGDDNVVRSYARTLRKRLEEYFAKEGAEEHWIVEVPRGGYVPIFIERPAKAPDFQVSTVSVLTQEDFGSHPSQTAETASLPPDPLKEGGRFAISRFGFRCCSPHRSFLEFSVSGSVTGASAPMLRRQSIAFGTNLRTAKIPCLCLAIPVLPSSWG